MWFRNYYSLCLLCTSTSFSALSSRFPPLCNRTKDSYFFSYGEFGELILKRSRAALRPLLAVHERGALPLARAAWGVIARKASHRRSPLTRAEPCHWPERRGVSLRVRRATMQVISGVSLRARWDATLVLPMNMFNSW